MDEKTIARFWSKVDRRGPDDCWGWHGCRDKKGYGRYAWGGKTTNRTRSAPRVALAISTVGFAADGDIATGQHCLHACDNPGCCNPAHLRWGTNAENICDRVTRGRSPFGENHYSKLRPEFVARGESKARSVLTTEAVVRIWAALGSTSQHDLAAQFGVNRGTIQCIADGRTWRHVTKDLAPHTSRRLGGRSRKCPVPPEPI